ncbi:hypothetical protein [Silvimonas sp.]|uniref:hypothetical protein n=1 Tax=Silvimonas sp. TaxID=2650811 RepID=UPI0028407835|nr:hypothetical protein [Silvimonas sp.]MDR3427903.1 hypothetical protein [Silvimonas sp.]
MKEVFVKLKQKFDGEVIGMVFGLPLFWLVSGVFIYSWVNASEQSDLPYGMKGYLIILGTGVVLATTLVLAMLIRVASGRLIVFILAAELVVTSIGQYVVCDEILEKVDFFNIQAEAYQTKYTDAIARLAPNGKEPMEKDKSELELWKKGFGINIKERENYKRLKKILHYIQNALSLFFAAFGASVMAGLVRFRDSNKETKNSQLVASLEKKPLPVVQHEADPPQVYVETKKPQAKTEIQKQQVNLPKKRRSQKRSK